MRAIFLSASVPVPGRGTFHETADPFLIQCAVREFVVGAIAHRRIVWGGHPAITPMIWAICEDLGISYAERVVLYQSRFFERQYPAENAHFGNVVFVESVDSDRAASLQLMRVEMLKRDDLDAAVFIGGMEGVEDEYALFKEFHPRAAVLAVASPGGAARLLAEKDAAETVDDIKSVDFAQLFHSKLFALLKGFNRPTKPLDRR